MQQSIKISDSSKWSIDKVTGELHSIQKLINVDTTNYINFFIRLITSLKKLTENQSQLLLIIWKTSSYIPSLKLEGNLFINNPLFKKQVREYGLDWSDAQINNEVSRIVKTTDLLIKIERGSYILNPQYFFKGTITGNTKLSITIEN